MYEFVSGPLMWISFIVFLLGLIYQVSKLVALTRKNEFGNPVAKKVVNKERSFKNILKWGRAIPSLHEIRLALKDSVLGKQPAIVILTFIFHVCIIVIPVFLMGHNILFFNSWKFSLCSFSESTTDCLTVIFLLCAFAFIVRRIFIPRVRAVSSVYDYLLLCVTIAPFLSGFLAYHQFFNYENIIIIHILSGELMLISIGLTKLGHMIFFFFVRFLIGTEYSFRSGSRVWNLSK